jgi:hypothetical protein
MLIDSGQTPAASYTPACEQCSLIEVCLPHARKRPVNAYLKEMLSDEETA